MSDVDALTNVTPDGGWTSLYHVPWSHVQNGTDTTRLPGAVHIHRSGDAVTLRATPYNATGERVGRAARIERGRDDALCRPRLRGWDRRAPRSGERRCRRCVDVAARYGVAWPNDGTIAP